MRVSFSLEKFEKNLDWNPVYTGLDRGAAHNVCNFRYKIPDHIPIVFHNLSGYDTHLFIRELGKKFNKNDIGVIGENKEKYISFSVKVAVQLAGVTDKNGEPVYKKIQLRFIDSMRFMQSSLSDLVDNLAETNTDGLKCCRDPALELLEIDASYKAHYKCGKCGFILEKQLNKESLKRRFANIRKICSCDEHFRLFLRKGVYPYEYIDSFDRFNETKLPPKKAFYNTLNIQDISDEDYQHAQQVWNRITPEGSHVTLGDYHDVYLKTDVLLLVDVFENFRDTCLNHYKLDPAHFYTAPGLAWKAALKITGVKLEQRLIKR